MRAGFRTGLLAASLLGGFSAPAVAQTPPPGVWQGRMGDLRVVLCSEDGQRVAYRYAGQRQSLQLDIEAEGWRESADGRVTGHWRPTEVGERLRGSWMSTRNKARRLDFALALAVAGPDACSRPEYLQDALTDSTVPMPALAVTGCARTDAGPSCVAAQGHMAGVIRGDGSRWEWGEHTRQVPARQPAGFAVVRQGSYHALGLKPDGGLWGWGDRSGGQLGGNEAGRDGVVKLGDGFIDAAAGRRMSYGLKRDGSVWAWGGVPPAGKFGDGSTPTPLKPRLVARGVVALSVANDDALAVIKADSSLWTTRTPLVGEEPINYPSEDGVPLGLVGTGFSQVSIGEVNIAAVKTDASLWAWGSNPSGQLGVGGGPEDRVAPVKVGDGFRQVAVGGSHVAAIKTDGSLWAWGDGRYGHALFGDCRAEDHATPARIGEGFVNVAVGEAFVLATRRDGSHWTWGWNWDRDDDDVDAACRPPVRVAFEDGVNPWDRPVLTRLAAPAALPPPSRGVVSIAVGAAHLAVVTADGMLWTWGRNANGQLGDGSLVDRARPVPVGRGYRRVFIDGDFTLAVKEDGSLWRFGVDRETLTTAQFTALKRGGKVEPARVANEVVDVASYGRERAAGLKGDDTLLWWGYRWEMTRYAGTVVGRDVRSLAGTPSGGTAIRRDGTLWRLRSHPGEVPRRFGSGFVGYLQREAQDVGLKSDGGLWLKAEAAAGAPASRRVRVAGDIIDMAAGDRCGLALKRDGSLWSWERPDADALVRIGDGFVRVAAAGSQGLALKGDGSLWAWTPAGRLVAVELPAPAAAR